MSGKSSQSLKNRISSRASRFKNRVLSVFSPTALDRHSPSPERATSRLDALPVAPVDSHLSPASTSHHQSRSTVSANLDTNSLLVPSSSSLRSRHPSVSAHHSGDLTNQAYSFDQQHTHLASPSPSLPVQGPTQSHSHLAPPWQAHQNRGALSGASGFSITGVNTFIDNNITSDDFLEKLLQETIRGAGFDSSDRHPPPRCHPGTRLAIIQRCLNFIVHCKDKEKMRWVLGPAGVGKSAVMQIVAEKAVDGFIVASIFFSVNGRQNGSKTFTTVAYQIAVNCKPYRQFLQDEITRDPDLLRKTLSTQFDKFIVEPFARQCLLDPTQRFLILIDGLDECNDPLTQRNLLDLISNFCMAYPISPVVWIVASRPEPHITLFFDKAEVKPAYTKEDIVIDSEEGREDVELYLRNELGKIRLAHLALQRKKEWPSKHELLKIATASGGLFAYASTVVKYIDDPLYGAPTSQLHDVLVAIDAGPKHHRSKDHPLAQLDALYERILSKVPPNVIANTKKLLLTQRFWRWGANKFRLRCNLVGLTEEAAYGAVRHLYSVVKVPDPGRADHRSLQYFHKSFEDYLYDPGRSNFFPNIQDDANELMAEISLRVVEEVLHASDVAAGGEGIKCRDFGYLNVGPGTACANVPLSWPGDEHFERTDDEIRFELYHSAITAIVERFRDGHPAFVNTSCFRVLTTCFASHGVYFPFHKLQAFAFDNFPHELVELGILKQVPLHALDYAAICGHIELQFTSLIGTDAKLSDPWESSCKHKKQQLYGLQERQGWKTTFGRYEEDMTSSLGFEGEGEDGTVTQAPEDDNIPRYNIVAGHKSHWECLSQTRWNVEACHSCLQRLFRYFKNNPDQPATVFFDSTGLCFVELEFVDPEDGMSLWRYRFLHSGLPSGATTSAIPPHTALGLPAEQRSQMAFPDLPLASPPPVSSPSSGNSTTGQGIGAGNPAVGVNQDFPPDDLDIDAVPPDLKKEGTDWFAIFNPKVKRQLDVSLVHTLMHESVVCCVRFSADGKYLATGCNRTAQIYETKTGKKTCVLIDETAGRSGDLYIRSVCFSPDGKFLATGAEDKQIRIWDIAKKRIRNVFDGHQQEIYSLDFSTDGRILVSGSGDKTTRIWDMVDGTSKVLTINDHESLNNDATVVSVAISPSGRYVAAGSVDTVIRIWDVATGMLVERLRGHRDSVYSVAFTPDGKGLVSGSLDKTLKYWDINALGGGGHGSTLMKTGKGGKGSRCTMNFTGHKDYVLSVAVSHDGQWVVSGSKDCGVQFWDAKNAIVQCAIQGHKNSVLQVDLSPTGSILATGGGDWQARIWSYDSV